MNTEHQSGDDGDLPEPAEHDIGGAMLAYHAWGAAMISIGTLIVGAVTMGPPGALMGGAGVVAGSVSTYTLLRVVPDD